MTEKGFYECLLNIDSKWSIVEVKIDENKLEVEVHLSYLSKLGICPFTHESCSVYDLAPVRKWRHLDTMQYKTYLVCRIPRVINSEDKVSSIEVPWADYSDRYTYEFSSRVIDLLRVTKNQTQTGLFLQTSFDVVNSIMTKAVERGLSNRAKYEDHTLIKSIGIDEKSFKKGHQYCTIITDATNKRILEIQVDRTKQAGCLAIKASLSIHQQEMVEVVTGDMWDAYQGAVKEELPNATYVLDRFHLIKYLNKAIDETRRLEVIYTPLLKHSRYPLLKNQENLTEKQAALFNQISTGNYEVSKAWKVREDFKAMFGQPDFAHATSLLDNWYKSIEKITIKPVIKVVEMFRRHSIAIVNSLCHSNSNAYAERMNGAIQELKTIGRGFRSTDNFRIAILFHYGKLNFNHSLKFL